VGEATAALSKDKPVQEPLVGILVLNWNSPQDTIRCLHSIKTSAYSNYLILVVDNGSIDDSVLQIQDTFPNITIIETEKNLGYTGGNNIGIQYFLKKEIGYIFLVNNDAVIAPDSLNYLLSIARIDSRNGFAGPKILALEEPKMLLSAGIYMNSAQDPVHRGIGEFDSGQYDRVSEVDALSGSACLVSREVIETIGMLDDNFFLYHEDIDWCFRCKNAGFKVLFVPSAKVWHPDPRIRDENSPLVIYYITRNSLLFKRKHHLGPWSTIRQLTNNLKTVISWSIKPKWKNKSIQRDALCNAITDYILKRWGCNKRFC